jgi:hypothetical protein
MSDLMARTSIKTQNPLMNSLEPNHAVIHATTSTGQVMQIPHASHKRSISDGNSIFQSMMSNRA